MRLAVLAAQLVAITLPASARVLAAVLPARRASQQDVLTAIATN